MEKHDFVIIGAGLSGSVLAYLLKKSNFDVILIEKEDINKKEKLCGGLVTDKTIKLLYSLFNKEEVDSLLKSHFNSASVISNSFEIMVDEINLATVRRKELDRYILNKYIELNGNIIYNECFDKIDFSNNIIHINDKEIKYKTLIAADGALSKLRSLKQGRKQNRNFALETFTNKRDDKLRIEFAEKINGYNWIIPCGERIGYGTGDVTSNFNIEGEYLRFLEKNNVEDTDTKGAFLPTGDDILLKDGNVFFVGDAAGLILPITGEGIYFAIKSSITLYNSIINNNDYCKEMKKDISLIRKHQKLNKIIYNKKLRNHIFKKANNSKIMLRACKYVCRRYIL